jgi:hypothetical protein
VLEVCQRAFVVAPQEAEERVGEDQVAEVARHSTEVSARTQEWNVRESRLPTFAARFVFHSVAGTPLMMETAIVVGLMEGEAECGRAQMPAHELPLRG